MRLLERAARIEPRADDMSALAAAVGDALAAGETPVRFTANSSARDGWMCEIGVIADSTARADDTSALPRAVAPLFDFRRRLYESQAAFNVAFIVPTGVGAEIGGHAGDATPAAIALAQVADTLITHPNVVNASDINELPPNGMYVEGSVLTRLLMGVVGLRPSRSNRVLVALDASYNERYAAYTVNAVNAARATYGLECAGIVRLDPPLRLYGGYTDGGRASGSVEGFGGLIDLLERRSADYDAVAIASVVDVPPSYHMDYFTSGGEMVNPWGGVEALLTHAVSAILDTPAAHAPMMESDDIAAVDPGVVDARMAAEVISITFLQSVLKGLQRAPRIVSDAAQLHYADTLSAEDVSCLITPDGCLGLPTLAALHQGIRVIAVSENRSLMGSDLAALPWARGQFIPVSNYWEAAGVCAALKAGVAPESLRRPLPTIRAWAD